MAYQHVYGPIDSRRFGRSLGVSVIPGKTCNCDCVFCGLGRTTSQLRHRQGFDSPDAIVAEIASALEEHGNGLDHITFCGEGEPTLYQALGYLIVQTKALTDTPVAVGTNSTMLGRDEVVRSLQLADVVAASLCAADEEAFSRLHRPGPHLGLERVLGGLADLKRGIRGELWIEVMLFAGCNDGERELGSLQQALERIGPDRVYVVTPGQDPGSDWASPPDAAAMERARQALPNATFLEGRSAPTHQATMFRGAEAARPEETGTTAPDGLD